MKNIFFLLFFFPLFSHINAQQTFRAGLLAGLNGSQIHGDTYSGFNQAGPVAGAFVCTNTSEKWYVQMEMQYSQKGSKKNPDPEKGDFTSFQIRMQYLEVPLLFRMNFKKIYFEIGETIGLLANVREWDSNGEVTPQGFRKWESAYLIGAGITLNDHWQINFRSTNSLFTVKKFPFPLYYQRFFSNLFNKGMYNNVIGLTASYRFGKKE